VIKKYKCKNSVFCGVNKKKIVKIEFFVKKQKNVLLE